MLGAMGPGRGFPKWIVKGGGKLGRVGSSIVGLWRRGTLPPTILRKVVQQATGG